MFTRQPGSAAFTGGVVVAAFSIALAISSGELVQKDSLMLPAFDMLGYYQ